MINTETSQSIHTTVADQTAYYPIGFKYDVSPDTGAPELLVTLDDVTLVYGTDYTVGVSGLQLVNEPEAGKTLTIKRDVVFTQEIDLQTGFISPDQIEDGFDRAVMRDQELRDAIAANGGDISDLQSDIADLQAADIVLQNNIDAKQDIITDLVAIRSGAAAGATAVQPDDLSTVATTGSYNDLTDKPSIGNGTITITQGGVTKGSFSVNQAETTTIEVDAGGGGAVDSVNGKTGVVVLNASDVGALPSTTKYGASLSLSINSTTYVITATLKDQNGNTLGSAQTIDLPLESVVVSGAYDSVTKEVVLTLEGGSTIRFSVADLVSGLQTEITSLNMLDADLVDDSTSTNKFVTASEKSAIATAVQPGDLATVATSGDYGDLLNKPTIPDTTHMVTDNTAQNISAVKTFTAANPDSTTAQTIVANYAVKFGTSGNNDLFAISANTNTSTLSIVGDNASNIIDIAASGAVLNHFQVTSSDVTFGGNSLINPGVMTGADGVNAGTSGLVPAPAATDNTKYLCGDGTWNAVPIDEDSAGGNLTICTSSTIIGAGTNNIAIGKDSLAGLGSSNIAIGCYAHAANGSVHIGTMSALATKSISILGTTSSTASYAIQLGGGINNSATNSDADTFKVANSNGNFEIMSADGTVPHGRLTNAVVSNTVTIAVADWNGGTTCTKTISGLTATSVVWVAPDSTSQSDYLTAGVYASAQTTDTITFTCTTTPTSALTVNVIYC